MKATIPALCRLFGGGRAAKRQRPALCLNLRLALSQPLQKWCTQSESIFAAVASKHVQVSSMDTAPLVCISLPAARHTLAVIASYGVRGEEHHTVTLQL